MERLYACLDENDIVIALEYLNIGEGGYYEGADEYVYIGPDSGFEDNQPQIGQIYDGVTNKFIG